VVLHILADTAQFMKMPRFRDRGTIVWFY